MKKINLNLKLNFKSAIFTFASLFFLYLLYLSIPSLYDSGRVQKALYNNLVQEFGLNLSLSSDISYRILPRPHFHIKDSKIYSDKKKDLDEIGEVKDMKIFISQKNLFDRDNIYIKEVILSKGNFFFNRQNVNFIKNLMKNEFSEKKIIIKKSKLFFNDKNGTIIFIYSINKLIFFKNQKDNIQQLKTNGNIFKIPIKFYWEKNLKNKNTLTNFKADRIDIDFINRGKFLNESYTYENILNILTNNFKTNYKILENGIEFNSRKSLIKNTPINYSGNIELSPFSFNTNINAKEIDIDYFFKNTALINGLLSSNILLNDNINGIIKLKTKKISKNKIFENSEININFEEGKINLNNSFATNNKFGKITIYDTRFNYLEDMSNLNGSVKLDIFNHNQFYKFFPVSKKKRNNRKFSKINFNFTFSLENSEFSIDRINFMDENNKIIQSKNVDDFVEDNYETRFKFSNKVLFKNFFKKVINTYLDEG